tara:strand:- start:40 stop:840 length:801 start_codon:yes stop_codon:yes gene_type:complete
MTTITPTNLADINDNMLWIILLLDNYSRGNISSKYRSPLHIVSIHLRPHVIAYEQLGTNHYEEVLEALTSYIVTHKILFNYSYENFEAMRIALANDVNSSLNKSDAEKINKMRKAFIEAASMTMNALHKSNYENIRYTIERCKLLTSLLYDPESPKKEEDQIRVKIYKELMSLESTINGEEPDYLKIMGEKLEKLEELVNNLSDSSTPTTNLEGGKKSKKQPKKEILGKMICIHKIPGDRKEYLKHKGKLITVKKYKELMKVKSKK